MIKYQTPEEEEEEILPFSSSFVIDYYDEIERRIEEQKKRKGKPTKEWKASINELIKTVNKMSSVKPYNLYI